MHQLLNHGANVNAEGNGGWTLLHLAAPRGRAETMRQLRDRGANINAEKIDGSTPLHMVSARGRTAIVRLFLDRGARADVRDKKGRDTSGGSGA